MCLITYKSHTCQHINRYYDLSEITDKLFHFGNHLFLALSLSSHHSAVLLLHVGTLFPL